MCHTILLLCGFKWKWFKFNILVKAGVLVQLKLRWLKLKKLVPGLPVSSPAARPPERSPGRSSRGWWSGCAAASSLALASSSKL